MATPGATISTLPDRSRDSSAREPAQDTTWCDRYRRRGRARGAPTAPPGHGVPRSLAVLSGHRLYRSMDQYCSGRGAELHRGLADGVRGVLPPAHVHRARAQLPVSQRGRLLRLEQAGLRGVCRLHHRMDLLDLQPSLLSRAVLLHRIGGAFPGWPIMARSGGRVPCISSSSPSSRWGSPLG